MSEAAAKPPVHPNPDYQDRDVWVKPIAWFVIGLTVMTLLIVGVMAIFFYFMELRMQASEASIPPAARARQLPPEPRLVVDEKIGLEEYLENARQVMESTAITDAEQGIARIPVAMAMRRVAENGLPRWSLPAPEPASAAVLEPEAVE